MEWTGESSKGDPDRTNQLLRTAEDVLGRAARLVAETRVLLAEARRIRTEIARTRRDAD
jgi:hypothetical protein